MVTLLLLLGPLLVSLPAEAIEESDILFHASYDTGLVADYASGSPEPRVEGEFQLVEGKSEKGLLCGEDGTSLEYETQANIASREGSISVWVKPVGWTGDDSLFHIWFDTAGADGRLLFYIYYAEHRNKLYVVGPDGHITQANSGASDWADGEWHHMVATWSPGEICVYQDGVLSESTTDGVALPTSLGDSFKVGTNTGWSYITGDHDMVLDELTIYGRPLLADEVSGLHAGERLPQPAPLHVQLAPYHAAHRLGVRVDARGARGDELVIETTVGTEPGAIRARARVSERMTEITIPIENLGVGTHPVEVALLSNGDEVARETLDLEVPAQPEWWHNRIGQDVGVLKPWTPVVQGPGVCRTWSCEYAWRKTLLPASMRARTGELLAAPIALDWRARGRIDSMGPASFQYDLMRDDKKEVVTNATGRGLRADAVAAVEFDGMARVRVTLSPEGPSVDLESLALRIPIRQEVAKLYGMHSCPLSGRAKAGSIPDEGVDSGFVPFVWIGNEDRGLSWFCEAPAGWRLDDPRHAIRVVPSEDHCELVITMIDRLTTLEEPLTLEFGLQATPVKPLPDDWRARRMAHWPDVFPGNILVAFWSSWSREPGYPIAKDLAEVNEFTDDWHAKGPVQLTPYICGTCTGSLSPEFEHYGREWEVLPIRTAQEQTPPRPMQHACPRSGWADFLVWGVDRLMDETRLDGLYFDITVPPLCRNAQHGCGYQDEDGRWQPAYQIFATRELFKRLYSVFQSKDRPLLLVNHMSGALTPCTLSFCDVYLEGEQFSATVRDDYLDTVALDEFRAQFMGKNYGLVPQFLPSFGRMDFNQLREGDTHQTETLLGLTLLHDTTVWAAWSHVDLVYKVWEAQDALPCSDAEFIGYWEDSELVPRTPDEVKVSVWRQADTMLVCLVNMDDEEVAAEIEMRLTGHHAASDPVWDRPVTFENGVLACAIEPHSFRLIRLDRQ